MVAEINHPILGKLTRHAQLSCWEGKVDLLPGCPITLWITTRTDLAPTDNLDALLKGGVAMLEWARRTVRDCRERIADELLELYNDTWASEDATAPMSRAEFITRIEPRTLDRDIDGSGFFYWTDDDMFAGHRIVVRFNEKYKISSISLAG